MAEWMETTLGEFISLQRGHDLPHRERRNGNVPVVGSGGVTGYHDTAVVAGPGITVGRAANLGVPTLIEEDFWPLNTTLYVKNFRENDVRFTYYLLRTLDLSGFNSGSVQPMLNRNYIKKFPIRVPGVTGQRAIADVLGALDDKIAINERIGTSCTALARTSYSDCVADSTASITVGDVLDLKYGKSLPAASRMEGEVPVFGSGGVSGSHNKKLVEGPGVIVGRKGTVGSVYWSEHAFFPIDTTFYVEMLNSAVPMEFAYFALTSLRLEAMNSDSAVPGLNRSNVLALPLPLPGEGTLGRFRKQVRSMLELRESVTAESLALAQLRDTLLPKLMSGELRVKDAERIAEDML